MNKFSSAIFDMDGLLIDSEPLWQEAGTETLQHFGVSLTPAQYHSTTGLRTPEWIDHWFTYFNIDKRSAPEAVDKILALALEKISAKGEALPGVQYIMEFFKEKGFKIGLASSSPLILINTVIDKLQIRPYLSAINSAEFLHYGKPHPQVFLDCATQLSVAPTTCICFEDSFNGMIAAKAARMRCVVIPAPEHHDETRWGAADLKLKRLDLFTEEKLALLNA
ncbi:MAG: hexitol phosphatase HxpB [Chitinophagaceae bacterium]